jgi:hypothetical protein
MAHGTTLQISNASTLRFAPARLGAFLALMLGVGCAADVQDHEPTSENDEQAESADQKHAATAQDEGDGDSEEEIGETSQAIVSKNIACGHAEGFPTWSAWGYTTVEFTNATAGGTTIRLVYQAGAGASVPVNVANHEQTGARWGGLTLWVTYLGWYDSWGNYRSCLDNDLVGAPTLIVQTY